MNFLAGNSSYKIFFFKSNTGSISLEIDTLHDFFQPFLLCMIVFVVL